MMPRCEKQPSICFCARRFVTTRGDARWPDNAVERTGGDVLECENELGKSKRLQGVQAAGGNTAQAVLLAGSQGRSEDLSKPLNMQLLFQICFRSFRSFAS